MCDFFQNFHFFTKMSHDVQKYPQFDIVPDFSSVCRYDFQILQIFWYRKLVVWAKTLDGISRKSQKNLKKHTTSKSQEGPPSTTRAELKASGQPSTRLPLGRLEEPNNLILFHFLFMLYKNYVSTMKILLGSELDFDFHVKFEK